ncbi:ATP-dependent helicase DCL1 [Hyphodiscus hymeniophilus]|uniref:Dicer-like protein 1 n=1 Tax=Hyphodiscus hymeniophilus TaxID=353542 RepID=A0A9P7B157_9HELO|nr:ATP-dependent helicase DCL1 [Hyphodiscus hymeniophilus]
MTGSSPLKLSLPPPEQYKTLSLPLATSPTMSPKAAEAVRPTLVPRTEKEMVSDLKRSRFSPSGPVKRRQTSISPDVPPDPVKIWVEQESKKGEVPGIPISEADSEEYDDEDEDEDVLPATIPRKISERKRRMNAIADKYIQDIAQKLLKDDIKHNRHIIEDQSARYIVNQAESKLMCRVEQKHADPSGSGKTLIAVLLLRHIFAQELEARASGDTKRISFFLHAVLKANLDQPMDMFCGDMNTDGFNRNTWEKHFNKNMVVVCTAEVLRQCLHKAYISMDRINLLIFDEAHHAKKGHPYASIIKDFYLQAKEGSILPKIFGMTASPVDAKVDVKKAATELETLLNCEIATTSDASLHAFKDSGLEEKMARYDTLGPVFETPLLRKMMEKLKANKVFKKPLTFARDATKELGSWCADQVWSFCLNDEEMKKLQASTERQYHVKKVAPPMELLEKSRVQLAEAEAVVKGHTFELPDYHDQLSVATTNLSSKAVMLISILKERFERPTDDKCIVFVQKRYTARALAILFSQPNIGTPHLKVGRLVGTRKGDAGDSNTSFRDQVITMMNFRKGIINCLFATSVAEEGLDIPDCNLVIRFDLYTTLIQYIQSRGRARHANSRYIHMFEDRNMEHTQMIKDVKRNEAVLKTFCEALPADRLLDGKAVELEKLLSKENKLPFYKVPETGAKLTYQISLLYLANFVSSLPHGANLMLNPEYVITVQNKQFICEVILPEESPIRGAIGRPCSTKQVAKCSAAFETCLLLRRGKYLDEYLSPIFTKQLPVMRNALLAVDSKKREKYDMRTKPECWAAGSSTEELFVMVLSLDCPESLDRASQPLALLTRSAVPQLPSFVLHFGGGKNSPVHCTPVSLSLKVEPSIVQQLNNFTLCIFDDVFSKEYEPDPSKMPYFLAPVKAQAKFDTSADPSDIIAWDILKSIDDYQTTWKEIPWEVMTWKTQLAEFFEGKYVVDPWDGSRKLWIVGPAPQYKPLDPPPENTAPRKGTRRNNSNILEYSCSLWAKSRERRTFDENQRVYEAQLISLNRNMLDDFEAPQEDIPTKCFVILEPLKISPLPSTVVAMAYLFPAIIHRIESYLIALEATHLLHLDIRPDLALEAVTKDSDNSDDHGAEKINFQRGMGNNYERLEFLGDCFLKMATSISLYGIFPDKDEFSYHVERMMMICNKNLCGNALNLRVFEYIRSQSFNRRAWYPEGLVLKKGKAAQVCKSHDLGDKPIADVCEAMIGAALLSSKETGNMDNAVRAVTELVSSENHRAMTWSDYYLLYEKPKYQLALPTAMQRDLARQVEEVHPYHFRYPRLLRSAFVHPSYPFSYEHIPNYQRLEFLGDSLLDMACINFLYHNFPAYDPQWLTEHKMAMVSNQFLGALCVKLGFHRHLLLFNATYQKQITDYVTDITEARNQAEEDAVRAGKPREDYSPDYWISVRQPPKCLPDIVEAYVGAVFVDSEYQYKEIEQFFDKHIKWYFTDMSIYDTFANKHPTTFLTKFLQINMGCMDWSVIPREIPNIDGSKPQVMAVVMVHDQIVANYKCESSRYAKVGAAKKALEFLKGLPLPEFRTKFGCHCRVSEEGFDVTEEELDHGTAV